MGLCPLDIIPYVSRGLGVKVSKFLASCGAGRGLILTSFGIAGGGWLVRGPGGGTRRGRTNPPEADKRGGEEWHEASSPEAGELRRNEQSSRRSSGCLLLEPLLKLLVREESHARCYLFTDRCDDEVAAHDSIAHLPVRSGYRSGY